MNTARIMEEIGKNYEVTQNSVKLSGIENTGAIVPDADVAEGVTLELSDEGKQKLAESQKNGQNQNLTDIIMFQEQMDKMREDNENAKEYADDTAKIMTIFRRIANGDIVPPKDENKLMEHSMEMYQAAKNLGSMKQNEEPKKYKSVDEDEEDESGVVSQEEAIRTLTDSRSSISVDIKISGVE